LTCSPSLTSCLVSPWKFSVEAVIDTQLSDLTCAFSLDNLLSSNTPEQDKPKQYFRLYLVITLYQSVIAGSATMLIGENSVTCCQHKTQEQVASRLLLSLYTCVSWLAAHCSHSRCLLTWQWTSVSTGSSSSHQLQFTAVRGVDGV